MSIRQTHTYVTLEVSREAYLEIAGKLKAAGYDHAFMPGGEIDMHGIAVKEVEGVPPCEHGVADYGYCEACSKERKRAAMEACGE